ncbi:hypothetical protein SAMN05216583_10981 [Selenomonas sp. KH1T6]|nr:hypothetical protein SAMN05216583_10981 [Selenomonas ruminantium]
MGSIAKFRKRQMGYLAAAVMAMAYMPTALALPQEEHNISQDVITDSGNVVNNRVINSPLRTTNVNVLAKWGSPTDCADIKVASKINKDKGKDTSLTMTVGRSISVDAGITSTDGKINLTLNSNNELDGKSERIDGASSNTTSVNYAVDGSEVEEGTPVTSTNITKVEEPDTEPQPEPQAESQSAGSGGSETTEPLVETEATIADQMEQPQLDALPTSNLAGNAAVAEGQESQVPGVDRVLGLQSVELPFFNEKRGTVKFYGTYDVSVALDKVKMEAVAKVLPEPDQPRTQYRELERELVTENGRGMFHLTYNGSTLDIYPADSAAKDMLVAGEGKKNEDIESQALYEVFNHMGISLGDLDGVYTHFESIKVRSFRR